MRIRARAFGWVAVALVAAAPAAAQSGGPAAPAADSIVLHFAWPIGIEAQVRYTHVIDRQGDTDQPTHIEVEGEYTMHVHEHELGLLVEHVDPVSVRYRSSPSLPADDPRRIVYSTLGVPVADWVVSKDGEFLQIQGLQALHARVTEAVERQAPRADLDAVIGQLANPDQLFNTGQERWGNMVADWVGAALREGEIGVGEGSEANPVINELQVAYQFQFKLDSLEACAAPGGRCVRVEISQLYDPVALNKTMNDALTRMGMTGVAFDGLAQESRVVLLTDPTTLLPYQMDMAKGVQGILTINGESRVFRRSDEVSADYTYTKR